MTTRIDLRHLSHRPVQASLALLLASLTACSSEAGSPPADAGSSEDAGPMSEGLVDNLHALGIPTEPRPLEDQAGQAMPETYSPFGPVLELGRRMELLVIGPSIGGQAASLLDDQSADPPFASKGPLDPVAWPWATDAVDAEARPGTIRAATAGELLTGGVDELAIAYFDQVQNQLRLKVLNLARSEPEVIDTLLVDAVGPVNDVSIAAGDFDGDGLDDLAVGYVLVQETEVSPGVTRLDSEATVLRVSAAGGALAVARAPMTTLRGRLLNSVMTLSIATGRLDYDDGEETVIVANEVAAAAATSSNVARARARFFVLDDAARSFAELRSGDVLGEDELGGLEVAAIASAAIGDLDQDSLDEIVLAGLSWRDSYDLSGCEGLHYLAVVLDDGTTSFRSAAGTRAPAAVTVCDNDGRAVRMQHLNANMVQLDGVGAPEVQINELVLGYDANATPALQIKYRLPEADYYGACQGQPYDRGASTVTVGDITGNGREQIVHHCRRSGTIDVWGLETGATTPTKLDSVTVMPSGAYPLVVAVDTEHDGKKNAAGEVTEGSQVLELMAGDAATDSYVITEPIVLAALAAPPCQADIGQNIDACVTTFGQTDSVSLEDESSYKLKASAGFGLKVTGGVVAQSEADFVAKFGVALAKAQSRTRSISKTVTYVTGPLEDTIVFAVVPYSRFRYRVRSAFDETLVGGIVSVFMPHRPVVQQAERGFYNRHVLNASDQVGTEVFAHTPGDISTYPGPEDVRSTLLRHCEGRDFPPCASLQAGPQAVGQGEGSTELGLEVATESGLKGELELSASIEVETTIATVKVTLEFEAERSWSLGTKVGKSTSYSGAVGSIGAENFGASRYSFGMFAYSYGNRGRFHVVNYWVE